MNKINLRYMLPNIFTCGSLFLGILSIVFSVKGDFSLAAWLLLVAAVFDGLDGPIARMTNTTSEFGKQLDSLADVVSFGTAPALMLYFYYGQEHGRFGILVLALFVIFGAIRLARFNISTSKEPNIFIGLPIPSAALFIIAWILFFETYYKLQDLDSLFLITTLGVTALMVSNIRYPSFKRINIKVGFSKALLLVISFLALTYLYPVLSMTLGINAYIIYGLTRAVQNLLKKRHTKPKQNEENDVLQ